MALVPGAVGVASAFANGLTLAGGTTLANYVEGSWTPIGTFTTPGTVSTANNVGRYTRVGNLVFISAQLEVTKGTGSGNFSVTGIPFTAATIAGLQHSSSAYIDGITSTQQDVFSNVTSAATTLTFTRINAGAAAALAAADLGATVTIVLNSVYRTTA